MDTTSDAHWSDEVEHGAKSKAFYFNRLTGEMAYTYRMVCSLGRRAGPWSTCARAWYSAQS
jgi:hypothetical protein